MISETNFIILSLGEMFLVLYPTLTFHFPDMLCQVSLHLNVFHKSRCQFAIKTNEPDFRIKYRECKRRHTQRILVIPTSGLCQVIASNVEYIERQFIVTFYLFRQFLWVLHLRQFLSSACKPSMKLWIQFSRMNDRIWI